MTQTFRTRLHRLPALIRPEEYLLVLVGVVFLLLHVEDVYTAAFRTSFVRAGWDTFLAYSVLVAIIAIWRTVRRISGMDDDLPGWALITAVALPIILVGVLAVRILPWKSSYIKLGWLLVAVWFVIGAALSIRGEERNESKTRRLVLYVYGTVRELLSYARAWMPFVILLAAYENALFLIARINHDLHDPGLFELDEILFGGHLDVWFQRLITPPTSFHILGKTIMLSTTEVFAFFYDSLYLYPVIIGMSLYLRRRIFEFRSFMLAFVLAGYVGYVGYVLVPVIGPAFYYPGLYQVDLATGAGRERLATMPSETLGEESTLSFYLLSQKLSDSSSWGGNIPRNCFPSLHTAWGVILLIFSYRYLRTLFYVFLFPLLMLIAATSYLRYHYMTDVAAGVLLAVAMANLTPYLEAKWRRWVGEEVREALPIRNRFWFVVKVAAYFIFAMAVTIFVYSTDSDSGRRAVAQTLGSRLVSSELPELQESEKVGAVFADAVELVGVRTDKPSYRYGDLIRLTMWWRCLKPFDGDWKIFVHVRAGPGPMVLNLDHHPAFGAYPIRLWAEGDVIEDVIVFRAPPPRAGGSFEVLTGLFRESAVTTRAPVTNSGTRAVNENAVEVTRLIVGW